MRVIFSDSSTSMWKRREKLCSEVSRLGGAVAEKVKSFADIRKEICGTWRSKPAYSVGGPTGIGWCLCGVYV